MTVGRIPNVEGGIQPTLLTTTGDIMYASSASNPARLGVGTTNQVLGVTAGVPAYQASSKSTLTTTGDILYASAANTPARLGIGSSAQVLTVAGGIPSLATPAGGGKVLQVVQGTTSTSTAIASTSLTDSGITATITPSSASSKVLVFVNAVVNTLKNANTGPQMEAVLKRGSTTILDYQGADKQMVTLVLSATTNIDITVPINMAILDTPATTSATIYKVQGSMASTGSSASVRFQPEGTPSTIILMEIGA